MSGAIVTANASLSYDGAAIRDDGEMLCLTDMWKAHGADPSRKPAEWLRSAQAEEFIAFVAENREVEISHLVKTGRGGSGGAGATWAHWQILFYACGGIALPCFVVAAVAAVALGGE